MVIKFTPEGRVAMVFGRKQEASDESTGPLKHPNPPLPAEPGRFRQVTDVAFDSTGNAYISDGYINSRVAKVDKDGNWLKSWGERGNGPGQFNTPHSIAVDAKNNIYVADRGNHRIQVFDSDGNFERADRDRCAGAAGRPAGDRQHPERGNDRRRDFCAGLAVDHLHHAGAEPSPLQRGRMARPHLQAIARRQSAGHARRKSGKQLKQFGWIHRDRLPVGERACGRANC